MHYAGPICISRWLVWVSLGSKTYLCVRRKKLLFLSVAVLWEEALSMVQLKLRGPNQREEGSQGRTRWGQIKNVGRNEGGIKIWEAAGWKKKKKENRREQGGRVLIAAAPCCLAWLLFTLAWSVRGSGLGCQAKGGHQNSFELSCLPSSPNQTWCTLTHTNTHAEAQSSFDHVLVFEGEVCDFHADFNSFLQVWAMVFLFKVFRSYFRLRLEQGHLTLTPTDHAGKVNKKLAGLLEIQKKKCENWCDIYIGIFQIVFTQIQGKCTWPFLDAALCVALHTFLWELKWAL